MTIKKIKKSGMALMTVLLLTFLLVLMTVSMIFVSTQHASFIGNIEGKEKALKAAESGIDYAIGQLNQDTAWGLDGDPKFFQGIIDPNGDPNDGTPPDCPFWPEFVYYDGNSINVDYGKDSGFTITFDSTSETGSVNNLFNPIEAPDSQTPPYTAKIVSTGRFFSPENPTIPKVTRTLVAYIVRSEYSPYNINVAGRLRINEGGEPSNIHITGKEPNDSGSIYSGCCVDPGIFNIVAGDASDIICNGGIFSSMGKISIPPSFDGSIIENLPQDYSVQEMDINAILANSGITEPSKKSGGTLTIQDSWNPWSTGYFHTGIVHKDNDTGVSISSGPGTDLTITEEMGYGTVIRLNHDIYLTSDLTIMGDLGAILRQTNRGWWGGEDNDVPEEEPAFGGERCFYLDLNGNTIYSDGDLNIGLNLMGKGRIFSKQNIHYFMGVNTDDTTIACKGDLTMEIPKSVSASTTSGLYYCGGNMSIQPLTNASPLFWGWGVDKPETIVFPGPSRNYPYTATTFASPDIPPNNTTLGRYVPRNIYGHPPVYSSHYEGASMIVAKVLDKKSGNYILYAGGIKKDLEFCLDYDGKRNVNFGNSVIKIEAVGSVIEVDLVSNNLHSGAPLPPGMTDGNLQILGEQIKTQFDNLSGTVDINFTGAIITAETDPVVNTEFVLNPGGEGAINLGYNGEYINALVNALRKNFKVKKISSYEI